ncbi:MAG: hypothetical protein ACREK2_00410 [Gemmatimonadota bacterium]
MKIPVAVLVGLVSIGCGDDGIAGPEPIALNDLIGNYVATELTVIVDEETVDVLDAGGQITLELTGSGTTTGRLFIPPPLGEDGEGQDADLTGIFFFDPQEAKVEFDHPADTFIRDVPFSVARNETGGIELHGSGSFEAEVEVVLTRQ